MRMLATTEQMRELDRTAIEERGIPSLELMENAAREAAQAVVNLVGPVKEPRRPDGVIGSAVSVAFVMMEDSREPTPEEQTLRRERQEALRWAMKELRPLERQIFYRKYYYRQSTAQIAAELSLTERAVEGKLYRARQRLRKALGGGDGHA